MTEIHVDIKKTPKQAEAYKLLCGNTHTLLEGGSRSGKTFLALFFILVRAFLIPCSDHLVTRFRFAHAKQSICFDTMPKLLRGVGLQNIVKLNKTDWYYDVPGGSKIWVDGLDDKERTEKILGREYATIFLNEASQISYSSYEIIQTRLNAPKGTHGKIIVDYNPPSTLHWGYKIFHQRKFPDGRPVPDGDYARIQMNPADNLENLNADYIKSLENLSAAQRNRFIKGEYSTDSGSLWKRAWIKYRRDDLPDFDRVVIGVDPSGTVNGDEVGIIVCGIRGGEYFVLDDYSMHGTPAEWSAAVAAAYDKWLADVVVAEKNYGGDMVEHTLKTASAAMNVKLIVSSRGKILRAEPISALYEKGLVYHRDQFLELEDEYCIFEPASDFSPNRLDAAVFALSELSGEGPSIWDVG